MALMRLLSLNDEKFRRESGESCDCDEHTPENSGDAEDDFGDDVWASLPDLLLEDIFDRLRIRYRFRAAQTCKNWYRAFHSARSWRTFVYRDLMFTRLRYTFQGRQYAIDHYRLRFLVSNTTRRWRSLIVAPLTLTSNTNRLFNLYEFLRVLTNFTEYYENRNDNPLQSLRCFEFNWHLQFHTSDSSAGVATTYGTGGQLLRQISHFLSHLTGLRSLALRQLQLDAKEADGFMSDLLNYFGEPLRTLCIRNLTKFAHSLCHFGLFLNLRKLIVSPQHLNDDATFLIASNVNIKDFIIIQDEKTQGAAAVSARAWTQFQRDAPHIRVHLRCAGRCEDDMLWQPMAPVYSLVYGNPAARLTCADALYIGENYAHTLRIYAQKGLQRRYRSNSFHDRADAALIQLIRSCPRLSLLAVRERVSTATVLLASHTSCYKPFRLVVRRNAVLKRSDWTYDREEWSRDFYLRLRSMARDYETTEAEIRRLYSKPYWRMVSDSDYLRFFKKD